MCHTIDFAMTMFGKECLYLIYGAFGRNVSNQDTGRVCRTQWNSNRWCRQHTADVELVLLKLYGISR